MASCYDTTAQRNMGAVERETETEREKELRKKGSEKGENWFT